MCSNEGQCYVRAWANQWFEANVTPPSFYLNKKQQKKVGRIIVSPLVLFFLPLNIFIIWYAQRKMKWLYCFCLGNELFFFFPPTAQKDVENGFFFLLACNKKEEWIQCILSLVPWNSKKKERVLPKVISLHHPQQTQQSNAVGVLDMVGRKIPLYISPLPDSRLTSSLSIGVVVSLLSLHWCVSPRDATAKQKGRRGENRQQES